MAELALGYGFDPLGKRKPATLIGTLRRAEPRSACGAGICWRCWAGCCCCGRCSTGKLARRRLGAGKLNLGVIVLSFPQRSTSWRMLLFSVFSFGLMLGRVLSLAVAALHLGRTGCRFTVWCGCSWEGLIVWPRWVKFLLPLAVIGPGVVAGELAVGVAGHRATAGFGHASHRRIAGHRPGQLSGLEICRRRRCWSLHLLNSYIYFGKYPFWNYVNAKRKPCCGRCTQSRSRGQGGFRAGRGHRAGFFAACLPGWHHNAGRIRLPWSY